MTNEAFLEPPSIVFQPQACAILTTHCAVDDILCRQSASSSITHSDDPQPTNSFGFSRSPKIDVNIPDSIENLTPTTLRSKRHAPWLTLTNNLRVRRVRTRSTIPRCANNPPWFLSVSLSGFTDTPSYYCHLPQKN